MIKTARLGVLLVAGALFLLTQPTPAFHISFERGDIFVSLETGPVLWYLPNGVRRGTLVSRVQGWGEGMAFDSSGNLYVARWRAGSLPLTGNTVEMFNVLGVSEGAVGRGYDCDPHTIAFDANGNAYVGQAGCRKSILKFVSSRADPIEFIVAEDNQGVFWMDLAPDGCTMFYTSYGPNVKRFDVCAGVQLPDFNAAPLPGGAGQDLRLLADGGVLVSSGEVIARLDLSGVVTRTYQGPPQSTLWSGLDLAEDGTFWVGNYFSSDLYRFDLDTGEILASFNTGSAPNTVVGIRIMK